MVTLNEVALYATRIVLILFIILGLIGNTLNLLIFTRPTLIRSSCTIYLIAASIDNILVILTSLLTRLLAGGFSYDITTISDFMCKLRYYAGYVFFAVSPYFFILACFDRYCSSSTSATRRAWSNRKTAIKLIIAAIILACILYVHMGIFFQLSINGTRRNCYTQPGTYDLFYKIFYVVIYSILPSAFMGLFSILTIKNVRQQAQRVKPALAKGSESLRRIDRQMIRMLFSQVLTQLICVLPFGMLNLSALFIVGVTPLMSFLNQIFILPLFVSYTTSFYVFTLSSRIYRQELMKILRFWKPRQQETEFTVGTVPSSTNIRQRR